MKLLFIALIALSSQVLAADCTQQAVGAFEMHEPKLMVKSAVFKGQLAPGEERPYLQGEIWNNSLIPLDVYEIHSSFMAKFVHVALVDRRTCHVKNFIEVSFQ